MKKILSIIPELWVDLIGRFAPGGLIVLISCKNLTPAFKLLPKDSWAGKVAVGVVVVYAVGLVFDLVADFLFSLLFLLFSRAFPQIKAAEPGGGGKCELEPRILPNTEMWAQIEAHDESAQLVFTKMAAEEAFLKSIALFLMLQLVLISLLTWLGLQPNAFRVLDDKMALIGGLIAAMCAVRMRFVIGQRLKQSRPPGRKK